MIMGIIRKSRNNRNKRDDNKENKSCKATATKVFFAEKGFSVIVRIAVERVIEQKDWKLFPASIHHLC